MSEWDIEIESNTKFKFNFKEIFSYRDLLLMFTRKDIVTTYQQTIFGPLWYFVQPLMTMLIYIFVFSNIANIPTDGIPPVLFYLSGIIIWNFFNECVTNTSDTFLKNIHIFEKVYFPRILIPFSKIISSFLKLFIQSFLFLIFYITYVVQEKINFSININFFLVPIILIAISTLGLGLGLIFSTITRKYRDLKFLFQFLLNLLMFATPIIYPLSSVKGKFSIMLNLNPLTHFFQFFRSCIFKDISFDVSGLLFSLFISFIILIFGFLIFSSAERNFVDTI